METISFKFREVSEESSGQALYSDGCSGARSDCCTRVCTRNNVNSDEGSLNRWDEYLEVNAGVVQY